MAAQGSRYLYNIHVHNNKSNQEKSKKKIFFFTKKYLQDVQYCVGSAVSEGKGEKDL